MSKAEGRVVELADVEPSAFAVEWATRWDKDPRVVELVLREAAAIVRMVGPVLITETAPRLRVRQQRHRPELERGRRAGRAAPRGSRRVGAGDPRAASPRSGVDVAVIVSDTFGRPWREGQTDVAIGVAGIAPLHSYIGETDPHGHEFRVQELCVVDELAAAAELVKGNTSRVPVAIIRGYSWRRDDAASMASVIRPAERDLFR